jgi:hypothetical protein
LQLRVCHYKANDATVIKLSKIIFTPVNMLDISAVRFGVELGLPRIREEHRLKVLEDKVM